MEKWTDEISYGVIPLRYVQEWEVFLVRHANGGHWSFPKGHHESSETPHETAKRELKEETGLEILEFLKLRSFTEQYAFENKGKTCRKTVTYFPAVVSEEKIEHAPDVLEGKWVNLVDVRDLITFEESKHIWDTFLTEFSKHDIKGE